MFGTRKLGRTSDSRKAMLRAMTTYLLENGKMETTFYRAKEVQPVAEKMIILGKKQGLANYCRALAWITKEDVAKRITIDREYTPAEDTEKVKQEYAYWVKAAERSKNWL